MVAGTGLQTSFLGPVTQVDSAAKYDLGTHRFEGGKVYKYVELKNATATVAVTAGADPVFYKADTGYGASQVVSDLTDADAVPVGAGIVAGTVAGVLATSYFCWIQIKGLATLGTAIAASVDATPVAAADGDVLVVGAADKTLRRANTVIDADAERRREVAVATDASAKEIICDFPW